MFLFFFFFFKGTFQLIFGKVRCSNDIIIVLSYTEIHSDLDKIEKPKMFILVSSVMTWARSKPLDPVSINQLNDNVLSIHVALINHNLFFPFLTTHLLFNRFISFTRYSPFCPHDNNLPDS